MIGRLALRSLTAHPIRSVVLAAGFGVGVAVMAILLGVAEIILRQAQSPALVGGGDVLIRLAPGVPAQPDPFGTLQADALRRRIRAASPYQTADLYLMTDGRAIRVTARAGIPEPGARARRQRDEHDCEPGAMRPRTKPGRARRRSGCSTRSTGSIRSPMRLRGTDSWAEWLYFNGRSGDARFYLTFLVGPRTADGRRSAGVRLQLERKTGWSPLPRRRSLTDAEVERAPDLTIGANSVRLDGLKYRIHLDLTGATGARVRGDLTLQASPGRLMPPLEITGSRGWVTGYVVPVMAGRTGRNARRRRRSDLACGRLRIPRPQLGILARRVMAMGTGAARRPLIRLRTCVRARRCGRLGSAAGLRWRAGPGRAARLRDRRPHHRNQTAPPGSPNGSRFARAARRSTSRCDSMWRQL